MNAAKVDDPTSRHPLEAMRLACPSWVMPGTWAENLEFILSQPENPQSGVELLVFDFDEATRASLSAELPAIARAAARLELSVHLPPRLQPGTVVLVDMLKDYAQTFVIHPPKPGEEEDFLAFMRAAATSSNSPSFVLEYTDREAFFRGLEVLDGAGFPSSSFPLCMDTGHLLLEGEDPASFAIWAGDRLARIHLHGIAPDAQGTMRDHAALVPGSPWLERLLPILRRFAGTIELELFEWAAVLASATSLAAAMRN
jgi:hypothetical protein